jgi:hypothetical protein
MKPKGELNLFKEIWRERLHRCEITNQPVFFAPITFAHVLSKGAWPELRLCKSNIILASPEVHQLWDFGDRTTLKSKPEWQWLFLLEEHLKSHIFREKFRNK